MKKTLLLLASLLLGGTMFAKQLSPDEALSLAMSRLNGSQYLSARSLASGASTSTLTLTHTELTKGNVPLYYVYGISDGGFVIASADDRAESLLGYTDNCDFETAKLNPAFMSWLNDCIGALNWLSEQSEGTQETKSAATRGTTLTPVAPLLGDIKWNQGAPYNNITPMRVNSKSENVHAPTGCVATAIAQVMMYHQWPERGTGSHTNEKETSQTVNFASSTYNWSVMKAKYGSNDTGTAADAVAKLMYDIGCAVDMDYGGDESGAVEYNIMKGLAYYFRYNKGISRKSRLYHSTDSWNQLLRSEIDKKLPILFCATTSSGGGHEFVLDGYDANGLYHVNWGWGGMANGYFEINVLDPDFQGTGGYAGGYIISQSAMIGVTPDKTNSTVVKPQVELYKQIYYNKDENLFSYCVTNRGLGDFKGEIGFILEEPSGKQNRIACLNGNTTDMSFTKSYVLSFNPNPVSSSGYTVYPYYSETIGGTIKELPVPVTALPRWGSCKDSNNNWTWGTWTDERVNLTFSNLVITRNYAGFNPKFKVQVEKPATDLNEYNDIIKVQVSKTVSGQEEVICYGYSQLFLNPGQKKEIEIECNFDAKDDKFKGNITAGQYNVRVIYETAGYLYSPSNLTKTVTIKTTTPSVLSYSGFVVDQENGKIAQGERLSARFTVKNRGGFDIKDYYLWIFDRTGDGVYNIKVSQEIAINGETVVEMSKPIDLEVGKYFAAFYVLKPTGLEKLEANRYYFDVIADPTALDEIESSDNSQSAQLYDLNGRPVTELKKGGLYIGKTKVIVR